MSTTLVHGSHVAARAIVMQKKTQRRVQFEMTESLESVLTCPHCGFARQETMPTDACLFFYECLNCKTVLRPKRGDCCVFCSFGLVKCPPIQDRHTCCG